MSTLRRIISFSGRKHSGKTELAKVCLKYNYKIINFADALKNLICVSLNISREYLDEYKDVIMEDNKYDLSDKITLIAKETRIDENIVRHFLSESFNSIRDILQIMGTNLIRTYNPMWHINQLKDKIINNPTVFYCIGDTRFSDEKRMIEELKGECWYIIRPKMFNISNHTSETSLNWSDFGNNIIINNIDKETLIIEWENYLCDGVVDSWRQYEKCRAFLDITKESCYVAGLLASSSGCIKTVKYNSMLILNNKDKRIVEKYKEYVECNDCNTLVSKNDLYSCYCINPYVIENIKLWNIMSKSNNVPIILKDNVDMLKYWIVGLIDGNDDDNNSMITIVASKYVIEYIYNLLQFGSIENTNDEYRLIFYNVDNIRLYNWLGDSVQMSIKI